MLSRCTRTSGVAAIWRRWHPLCWGTQCGAKTQTSSAVDPFFLSPVLQLLLTVCCCGTKGHAHALPAISALCHPCRASRMDHNISSCTCSSLSHAFVGEQAKTLLKWRSPCARVEPHRPEPGAGRGHGGRAHARARRRQRQRDGAGARPSATSRSAACGAGVCAARCARAGRRAGARRSAARTDLGSGFELPAQSAAGPRVEQAGAVPGACVPAAVP